MGALGLAGEVAFMHQQNGRNELMIITAFALTLAALGLWVW